MTQSHRGMGGNIKLPKPALAVASAVVISPTPIKILSSPDLPYLLYRQQHAHGAVVCLQPLYWIQR
jgi:hypothetical protein